MIVERKIVKFLQLKKFTASDILFFIFYFSIKFYLKKINNFLIFQYNEI